MTGREATEGKTNAEGSKETRGQSLSDYEIVQEAIKKSMDTKGMAERKAVIAQASSSGLSELRAEEIIEQMLFRGDLFKPRHGQLKPVL